MSLISYASDKKALGTKWDGYNNPFRIDKNFETRFKSLPLSGDMSKVGLGWPGYYWSNLKAGISQRWQSNLKKKSEHFGYQLYSLYELKSLGEDEISKLSAAEKYDIMMANYSYPTVERVRKQTKGSRSDWHGICHGVSPSGLHHAEPQVKTLTNRDGLKVKFYSSDIKALVSFYYARISDYGITQIGRRCGKSKRGLFKAKSCRDVHPASLHIIMANRLGVTKNGFIADIDRYKEVWNHVAVKFESQVLGYSPAKSNSTPGSYKVVTVKSKVHYTGYVTPKKLPILGTDNAKWDIREYKYTLDLTYNGKIIGGKWISKERPDFLWVKDKETFKDSYYGNIKSLL